MHVLLKYTWRASLDTDRYWYVPLVQSTHAHTSTHHQGYSKEIRVCNIRLCSAHLLCKNDSDVLDGVRNIRMVWPQRLELYI